jgi:ATP adenylyltransferase
VKPLWTPWRMAYIKSNKEMGCIFCQKPQEDKSKENYILHRSRDVYVIMNKYPYNNGHLMIVPYRHVPSLKDLQEEELNELARVVKKCEIALEESLHPDGFNIGINLGKAAGAGFAEHIHVHIVPRYFGDTNFMAAIGETKTIPELLTSTYQKLLPYFK